MGVIEDGASHDGAPPAALADVDTLAVAVGDNRIHDERAIGPNEVQAPRYVAPVARRPRHARPGDNAIDNPHPPQRLGTVDDDSAAIGMVYPAVNDGAIVPAVTHGNPVARTVADGQTLHNHARAADTDHRRPALAVARPVTDLPIAVQNRARLAFPRHPVRTEYQPFPVDARADVDRIAGPCQPCRRAQGWERSPFPRRALSHVIRCH